jgi:hypothetical protein
MKSPPFGVGFSAFGRTSDLLQLQSELRPLPIPVSVATDHSPQDIRRAGYFSALVVLVSLVADGWGHKSTEVAHQLFLLPVTVLFLGCLYQLLNRGQGGGAGPWTTRRTLLLAWFFELGFAALYVYECKHFATFGYHLRLLPAIGVLGGALALLALTLRERVGAGYVFYVTLLASAGGLLLSILSFPLNYLRSDMLPVIVWADRSLLQHTDPYITLHVADRLYDFPYLPGMMLAYYPFAFARLDLRFGSMAYLLGSAGLIYWAARRARRLEVAALLALFLLCPFLQYRHELYLEPHWFTLVLVFVLMQRRHFAWAAVAFGVSMAIYQFSWILFPFFLLYGLRRRGWGEVAKLAVLGAVSALLLTGPFLRSASHRIASNTVGQWGHMASHANAEPINLSFWATYIIHPDKLLRLQAALMIVIFLYCWMRGRCADFADTLRWMIVALTTFVMFNVLVDGYFYLMLLVPMLVFTCVANGWWAEPDVPTVAHAL